MRVFVTLILSLCFISCDQDGSETAALTSRVSLLESRIDSLEQKIQLLINKQEPTINKKKNSVTIKKSPPPQNLMLSDKKAAPESENATLPVNQQRSSYKEPTSTSSVSHQCMATTKKGSRCKRMVRGGSHCWQHGG